MTRVAIRLGSSGEGQVVEWRFGILIKEGDDGIVHVSEVHQRAVTLAAPNQLWVEPIWGATVHAGFQRYSVHDARIYVHSPKDVYINRF